MSGNFAAHRVPPLATCVAVGINTMAGIVQFTSFDPRTLRHYTLCPNAVINRGEYYRIVTSPYLHGGILHFGVNMMSTVAIGRSLERRFGTVRMCAWLLVATLLSGTTHCAIAYALAQPRYMLQHSLGFSGVLFALIVSETWRSNVSRSLFGMMEVPARYYPLAALVAIQVLIPGVSFLGHLAGLLVGAMEYYGFILLPSIALSGRLDDYGARFLGGRLEYVPTPQEQPAVGKPKEAFLYAKKTAFHFIGFLVTVVGIDRCVGRAKEAWAKRRRRRRSVAPTTFNDDLEEAARLVHYPDDEKDAGTKENVDEMAVSVSAEAAAAGAAVDSVERQAPGRVVGVRDHNSRQQQQPPQTSISI